MLLKEGRKALFFVCLPVVGGGEGSRTPFTWMTVPVKQSNATPKHTGWIDSDIPMNENPEFFLKRFLVLHIDVLQESF